MCFYKKTLFNDGHHQKVCPSLLPWDEDTPHFCFQLLPAKSQGIGRGLISTGCSVQCSRLTPLLPLRASL